MVADWASWRATVEATVRDRGVWYGLANGDWEPIATLEPLGRPTEVHTRMASPELSMQLPGVVDGKVSVVADELIAPDLGVFDEQGYFDAANVENRNIIVARAGARGRQAYFIPFNDAEGQGAPERVGVEATGLLSLLEAHPCPSIPESWRGAWETKKADAGATYATPRTYSLVEFSTKADGYTVTGPAETVIRRVVQDSLDAVQAHMVKLEPEWKRPHMVVDFAPTGRVSPEAFVRVQDDFVLPTVAETARNAGVNISADLWWPGDPAVTVRTSKPDQALRVGPRSWDHPIAVVRVEQIEEV